MCKRTLNLANKTISDIQYEEIFYSDSQYMMHIEKANFDKNSEILIKSRMSWEDIQKIVMATKVLRKFGVKNISLYVPYFLGARSDRAFFSISVNYLRDIISPIINSLNFEEVIVLDPHSNVLEACINNFRNDTETYYTFIQKAMKSCTKLPVLIAPDEGASKKVYNLAKMFDVKYITCSKKRDVRTGRITEIIVPKIDKGEELLVVDDICDGGATFIELAKELDETSPANLRLAVTHGIFSKGIGVVEKYYNAIYTTNSVKNLTSYTIGDCSFDCFDLFK